MAEKNNKVTISEETQIDVPPPRDLMTLEKRDWRRLKRMVGSIKSSHNWWENGTWFSASAVLTCFVTAVALKGDLQKVFFGVSCASVIITGILFLASRTFSKTIETSKNQVLLEMNETEENAKLHQQAQTNNSILEVTKAIYCTEKKSFDVTEAVAKMVKDNTLQFEVSNALGGDPEPGIVKTLKLSYILSGKKLEKEYKEKEQVFLPES